ncbi:hypothetical protein ACJMK2_021546 [Sinanodonta woodiana]|uniref:Uncharacterized protein n=1 Tax=Sinanodonta woodiana TaxID=1069815 RepID=A0ABD3THX8_SINWO
MMNKASVLLICVVAQYVKTEDNSNTRETNIPSSARRVSQFTAGRTKCRRDENCGYHQKTDYSWCYTDYSDGWDYCCTGICSYYTNSLECPSGSQRQYCGSVRKSDIQGRPCLDTFPCGIHKNELQKGNTYYWCYVDLDGNWDFCCAPHSGCQKRSSRSAWCNVEASTFSTAWQRWKPEEETVIYS